MSVFLPDEPIFRNPPLSWGFLFYWLEAHKKSPGVCPGILENFQEVYLPSSFMLGCSWNKGPQSQAGFSSGAAAGCCSAAGACCTGVS